MFVRSAAGGGIAFEYWTTALALCCCLLCQGCGSETGRVPLKGSIVDDKTFVGTISFRPSKANPELTVSTTRIHNGHYSFSRADGPFPGTYEVTIEKEIVIPKGASAEPVAPESWQFTRTIPAADSRETFDPDFTLERSDRNPSE